MTPEPMPARSPEGAPPVLTATRLWALLLVLVAAVLGVAAHKLAPLLDPQPDLLAPLDPACDLRAGPCIARFPAGGRVRFAIEPRAIPVVTPLTLRVETWGLPVRSAEVDFVGIDMSMGYNRAVLAPAGRAAGAPGADGVTPAGAGVGEGADRTRQDSGDVRLFQGPAMLPVCVRARMTWEARVLLHTPDGLLAAPFRFATRSR